MVDLVDHQMPATRLQDLRQAGQFVAVKQGTGRVGRRGDQRADAVPVPMTFDQLGSQLVAHLRPHRHQLRRALDEPQEVPIARIAGVGQQPVLARIDQQAAGEQQRTGSAGSNQHPFGVNRQLITLGVETGNGLAQLRQPASGGIAGMPGGQGSLPSRDNGRGCGEVRLTDFQVDNIMPKRLQFVGPRQQRHDMKGFDCTATRAIRRGHLTFLTRTKREFYRRSPDTAAIVKFGSSAPRFDLVSSPACSRRPARAGRGTHYPAQWT